MIIDVALVPAETRNWRNRVCIVVDVLRASSTIVTLLDHGCEAVLPVRSVAEARRYKKEHKNYILAGERRGLPPAGFDLGNSPVEISGLDLTGRTAVLTSSNGTAALLDVAGAPAVLIGSFLNGTACCQRAIACADTAEAGVRSAGIGIVCAGTHRRFVLDDAVCAGWLVELTARLLREQGAHPELTDGATTASRLWQSYEGDIGAAFGSSTSGQRITEIGLAADLAYCGQVDTSTTVPALVPGAPPRVLKRA